ncbi:hypothetical protein PENTCL1PPCAC_1303, partial [Pristionchus entomophagus]
KQYDKLHHDPVYTRISTATTFGGEYEPSPRQQQTFHHPSIFPNPFLNHSPFGGCDCDERDEREDEYEERKSLPRREEEEYEERISESVPRGRKLPGRLRDIDDFHEKSRDTIPR